MASTMVSGSPRGSGRAANASPAGSTVSEYSWSSAEEGSGGRIVQSLLGSLVHLPIDFVGDVLQHAAVEDAFLDQELGEKQHRIALAFQLALGGGLVKPLVVGKRMRIRADDVGVHQRRPLALAAMIRGAAQNAVGGQKIRAIHFQAQQAGEALHQPRNVAAGGLAFDGHGDGVAVVLDQEKHRQAFQAGGVERFPELALAGGAVARADQRDFIRRAGIARGSRAPHRLVELRAGGR